MPCCRLREFESSHPSQPVRRRVFRELGKPATVATTLNGLRARSCVSQGLARLSASWVTVPVLPLRLKDCDTHIQIIFAQGAEVPRKFFVGTMDTYPGTYQEEGVCKFVGKIEFVINAGAEDSFAKRNNSVIRGTNTVSKTFTRNDVMEVAMRTYILAIATAALFAIPTASFSESGHHRYYNRYEGLYDRYESGRCRESRAACAHKEKLGEQVMGNCRRFRELCD